MKIKKKSGGGGRGGGGRGWAGFGSDQIRGGVSVWI